MVNPLTLSLPIDTLQHDVERILGHSNLIVQSDTGTGKSTRLPVWASTYGRVLVVEPRRVACTSLAGFVAETLGTDIGDQVGYAIKFDYRFSEDSRIVFATPGVVLRWFSEDKLAQFDVVMIDEFHERRAETDLLAALLLKHDAHRLIITSATLDSRKLADYFMAEILSADAKTYGVTISHHALDSQHMPSGKGLESRIKPLVAKALERGGDVLVFLPGKKEISQCQAVLKCLDADVIPLHASVSDTDRHRALCPSDNPRIVLATNVAETSLTIPGIVTVIDSGMERRTHQRNGRTALALHAISKASAKQRAGRAGRIAAGFCERLYGEHAPLETFTPPELEREDLTETMLAAACCGFRLDALSFLSALPEKSLQVATTRLVAMGAIDGDGQVTDHGKRLYPLPIDSLFAHLISDMEKKADKEAMVDLAAVLQTPMTVWRRRSGELTLDDYKAWNPALCDVVTSIAVLRGEQPADIIDVDPIALEEARRLSASIREALSLPQWEVASRFNRETLLKNVLVVAPELAYVRREKRQQAFGNGVSEVMLSRDSDFPAEPQAAIVFDQFHLAGRGVKQTTSYATCMAPVPFDWLAEAGVGEEIVAESVDINGQVLDRVQRIYAGRVISETHQAAQGESLIRALASQILDGVWLEGCGERLKRDIAFWNLYQYLEAPEPEPPVEPQRWVEQKLLALGVESADDLALIDRDDLNFEGIPSWEFDDFAGKYPLELQLPELQLAVEYLKGKRIVVLHHTGGKRKEGPKRWELPVWRGWKVQYRKASRVVDIR
ncbi:ATP-dependent RNA helicase [Grimontia hollisae]|uniref:Putative ATP-dependent helicase n=1 Tax=Grimontia hollisae CIP 101886 TaxID=675812 RepID=D0IAJ8_GRIHO|nr:helicase-related protein [Grimontia hollisae]AMG31886.1 ATP-dependent RNA helicase [Grimontia hollisae]EEY70916.1 putative ATP-dependent helicase [Grimontia hollisae CIP 101886]STO44542.1 ATP-dependent RNA helicase HrpB [Grimontia hollisae]